MCGGLGKGVIWDCAFFLRNSRLKFKYYCYMKVDTIFAKCTRTVHAADSAVSVCRVDALQVRSKVTSVKGHSCHVLHAHAWYTSNVL